MKRIYRKLLAREKYDYLLIRKKKNIMERNGGKNGKKENFKRKFKGNIILEMGKGKKIHIIRNYLTVLIYALL